MLIELTDDQIDSIVSQEMERLVVTDWVEGGIKKHALKVFAYYSEPSQTKRLKRTFKKIRGKS